VTALIEVSRSRFTASALRSARAVNIPRKRGLTCVAFRAPYFTGTALCNNTSRFEVSGACPNDGAYRRCPRRSSLPGPPTRAVRLECGHRRWTVDMNQSGLNQSMPQPGHRGVLDCPQWQTQVRRGQAQKPGRVFDRSGVRFEGGQSMMNRPAARSCTSPNYLVHSGRKRISRAILDKL